MSKPWPPPPDLASIQELVRAADPEGHLAEGAPADEYEPEEEAIFASIGHLAIGDLTAQKLQPLLEEIWGKSFSISESELASRTPALSSLAKQIERFFGPQAKPQVRGA
jgi:hypothetical protein